MKCLLLNCKIIRFTYLIPFNLHTLYHLSIIVFPFDSWTFSSSAKLIFNFGFSLTCSQMQDCLSALRSCACRSFLAGISWYTPLSCKRLRTVSGLTFNWSICLNLVAFVYGFASTARTMASSCSREVTRGRGFLSVWRLTWVTVMHNKDKIYFIFFS